MMDYTIPKHIRRNVEEFKAFLRERLKPEMSSWYKRGEIPVGFFHRMAAGGWLGIRWEGGKLVHQSALREALLQEELAKLSPGVAVAVLAHVHLGLAALFLCGSDRLKNAYGSKAAAGDILMSLGNTENTAGSDVAAVAMRAEKVDGGWLLNGSKAYVTNGSLAGLSVVTAVSDPEAGRSRRLSMFLADLNAPGIKRVKLNKTVWIPSDLTRIQFSDVFIGDDHLLGERGRGLQQVLSVFTRCRVPISALTLGTASGAYEMALDHAATRKAFGTKLIDFQAKAFEFADFYARMEAARLMLWKACALIDAGEDFRQASSLAKYLAVQIAREVTPWAADLFGAASVVYEHPIHKFPMDAWASSLGEGTQDIQKLVIFREMLKHYGRE
jgi:alkylation response protein AidB-like acyl-CoA dehydrogenase